MLLDAIDQTYFAFRSRLRDIRQATTCDCNACRLIPNLDLTMKVELLRKRRRFESWFIRSKAFLMLDDVDQSNSKPCSFQDGSDDARPKHRRTLTTAPECCAGRRHPNDSIARDGH